MDKKMEFEIGVSYLVDLEEIYYVTVLDFSPSGKFVHVHEEDDDDKFWFSNNPKVILEKLE